MVKSVYTKHVGKNDRYRFNSSYFFTLYFCYSAVTNIWHLFSSVVFLTAVAYVALNGIPMRITDMSGSGVGGLLGQMH